MKNNNLEIFKVGLFIGFLLGFATLAFILKLIGL